MYNILLIFIITVSLIDQYCLVHYVSYETELNPIGKALIAFGGVPLFALAKAGGTALVAWLLLRFRHAKFAMPVVVILAVFQLWLLFFMLY